MTFKMKYPIKTDYIQKGKRRPGTYIKPYFGVLHDTGNSGSTAQNNRNYYNNTPNDPTAASAHTFIDDQQILEVIPATVDRAERSHHVRYNVTADNHLFGDDANDIAIGVELCWGGKINFEESYKRFVWYCAYVSYKFEFSPSRWVGHEKLDPGRKTDPTNALKRYGKTYSQLLKDIVSEYNECIKPEPEVTKAEIIEEVKQVMRDINVVTKDYAKDWEEAKMNGYFDGSRPGADLTREEAAIVVNKLRKNFKGLFAEVNMKIANLEKLVKELNK